MKGLIRKYMPHIIGLIIIIVMVSCTVSPTHGDSEQLYSVDGANSGVIVRPKYKVGDVVYLKPDSAKVVIVNVYTIRKILEYGVKKTVEHYVSEQRISEELIY